MVENTVVQKPSKAVRQKRDVIFSALTFFSFYVKTKRK